MQCVWVVCCVCEMSLKEEESVVGESVVPVVGESVVRIALNAITQIEGLDDVVYQNFRPNFVMFQDAIAQGKDHHLPLIEADRRVAEQAQKCLVHLDKVDGLASTLQAHIRTLREAITNMVIEARINQCESTCSTCDKVQEDWLGEDEECEECDKKATKIQAAIQRERKNHTSQGLLLCLFYVLLLLVIHFLILI